MFAKDKVSQSMIDAVNSVLEEEKKQMLLEPELDETGFHKAAHAARKAGQSHFEFQGKKYPVTSKTHKEAWEDMVKAQKEKNKPQPSGGSGVKQGSRYGGSKQKEEPKDMKEDKDCVTEPEAKKIAKKEVSHHNVTMHKGQKNTVKEGSFASKLLTHISENKNPNPEDIFTDNNLGEEEMTDAQMKKREKIVMSMKKGMAGFKQRYGKNWKNVMYATATKQAMKEDSSDEWNGSYDFFVEQAEDLEEADKMHSQYPRKDQFQGDELKKREFWAGSGKDKLKRDIKKSLGFKALKMKEEVELDEKNESHTHAAHYENDKGEWTGMNLFAAKDDEDAIKQAHAKCKEGCRLSRVERHIPVKEEVGQLDEIKSLERYSKKMDVDLDHLKAAHKIDMEKTDRDTAHKMMKKSLGSKYNKDHANWSINAFREEVELDESEPAYKDKPDHKPMSDVVNRKKTVKQIMKGSKYFGSGKMKEEVELEEDVEVELDKKGDKITTDMLRGRVAGGKINSFKNYKVDLKTSGEEPIPKDIDRGSDTREQQKITTNPGPVDIKLDDKLGHPASQEHFSTEKQITHEEVEVLDESSMLDKYLSSRGINPRFLSKDSKISYSKSNEFKKWLSSHQFEATEVPFDKPYKDTEKVTTDKSGAQHTPMSRAKDLARQAFKKVKQETMMGKISN